MNPKRIQAILVGIDYAENPKAVLDGPGTDCLNVGRWLNRMNGTYANMAFFLSLLEKNKSIEELLEQGSDEKPFVSAATAAKLMNYVSTNLATKTGDILFFY